MASVETNVHCQQEGLLYQGAPGASVDIACCWSVCFGCSQCVFVCVCADVSCCCCCVVVLVLALVLILVLVLVLEVLMAEM